MKQDNAKRAIKVLEIDLAKKSFQLGILGTHNLSFGN